MSAPCPGHLADVVKIVEAMKTSKQLVLRLWLDSESVSVSVLQTARTATERTTMAVIIVLSIADGVQHTEHSTFFDI